MRLILRLRTVSNKRPQREFAAAQQEMMIDKQTTKHETGTQLFAASHSGNAISAQRRRVSVLHKQ